VHSENQFDPTKSQITRLSHSTEFHPLAPLPQPARRTSASMSCPGKSRCPMTHESCGFCRKNNRASEQKLRVFYFGSSRAPLQSTMRLRRASSPPFSKTSLVSVISLIILAARSVSPAGSPSRFSPSRPCHCCLFLLPSTRAYIKDPDPTWPRQRSCDQRPQFLILRARFFLFTHGLTVRWRTEPVCYRSFYRFYTLLLVLFSIFVSSQSSSPDRSLQVCDPS
jgi:hypothetical protein